MYSILPKLREDMQLRGFSKHTIRSYTERVTEYLSLLNKPLSATTEYDVRAFISALSAEYPASYAGFCQRTHGGCPLSL